MLTTHIKVIFIIILASTVAIFGLYISADKSVRYSQGFERKFERNFIKVSDIVPINQNSYISGLAGDQVYIGNLEKGLIIVEFDLGESKAETIELTINGNKPSNPYIKIDSPHFYIKDGKMPALFTGTIGHWIAKETLHYQIPFIDVALISSNSFALRSINGKNENSIVKVSKAEPHVVVMDETLNKKIEGLFSTAGFIHYSRSINKIIYLFHYQNKYILLDTLLNVSGEGRTIDTVSKVKINPIQISDDTYTLASPSAVVNNGSSVFEHCLFVWSNVMGSNEERDIFNISSVIDVYNLHDMSYGFSFYLPDYSDEKLRSFQVNSKIIACKYDHYVVLYTFDIKSLDKYFETVNNSSKHLKDILLAGRIPDSLVENSGTIAMAGNHRNLYKK